MRTSNDGSSPGGDEELARNWLGDLLLGAVTLASGGANTDKFNV
jgi:hypothetical protein